jgi:hypothetical protein
MKIRNGFVSNSSSSSFIIINKSDNDLSLVDFVKENPTLIQDFLDEYYWNKDDSEYTQENMIISAEQNDYIIPANSSDEYKFGDEDGTLIGKVFDYILRNGGTSENFEWYSYKQYR